MGLELLTIGTLILIIGLIIDYTKDASKKNPQIWTIIGVFFVVGLIVEYASISFLQVDVKALAGQWTLDIWLFNMPIESYLIYLTLPYLVMVTYYGFVKK